MSRIELRSLWEARVREYRLSGQPATVWCEERQLSIHQFRYWLRRFSTGKASSVSRASSVHWLSVDVNDSPARVAASHHPIVICIGEWRIEVSEQFNPSVLQRVVQSLTTLC